MCEICFDGSCSNPYNHPEAHELSLANLTQVGLDKMLDKIDEQFKLINKLQRCVDIINDSEQDGLVNIREQIDEVLKE